MIEEILKKLAKEHTLKESMISVKDVVEPVFLRLRLDNIVERFNQIPDSYKTDWNKLLSDVKLSKGIISNLIKGLFGTYGGNQTFIYDLNTNQHSPKDVSMIFANTPNRQQQRLLANVIRESLGPQYTVVIVNSDETSNKEAEEYVKIEVARAKLEGKKLVILSNNMASRSFSVSEIDTVFLMFDRGSYSAVSQKVSRVLTPGLTFDDQVKKYGYIVSVSLDCNREEISPMDEYIIYESEKVEVDELSDGIRRTLNSINIFTNGESGLLEPIEIDEYSKKLLNSSSLISLGKSSSNPEKIITDENLVKLLTGIEINDTRPEEQKLLSIDSSLVERTIGKKESKKQKLEKDKVFLLKEKLKKHLENIVENIVEVSEINNCESDDILECLDMIIEKGYDDEVIFELDFNSLTLKSIIKSGAVSHKLLNTIITNYNKNENELNYN
jgi:hypothetical protein